MSDFEKDMRAAAYEALSKTNPGIVKSLKASLLLGETPKGIKENLVRKFGDNNLTVNAAILAVYHLKEHPELLEGSHEA